MKAIFRPGVDMTFDTVMQDKASLRLFLNALNAGETWIFDLKAVKECDSAGVALLIEAKRLSQLAGLTCHFEGISAMIRSLILFCGVSFLSQESTGG